MENINRTKFDQIERALWNGLDEEQHNIIVIKYLGNKKRKDDYIYDKLLMNRDKFYKRKKSAVWLIAIALGFI
ncbi:hypothetical protein BTJ44_04791 [Bacillus mycoides]|nr:hypothetical protein BTJ44_04791 [Bacillus mycoides]